jgi:hypothetical protein
MLLLLLHQHTENKSHQLSPPKAMTYIQNTHDHHRQFYRKQKILLRDHENPNPKL